MEESGDNKAKRNLCERARAWVGTPPFYLIINFLLSQWGDWMWQFSVGVYLSELSDGSLHLAAIFGFVGGGCVLLLGGLIGDWVDRNGRLKVVRISLFVQNFAVALSAVGVCVALRLKQTYADSNLQLKYSVEAFVLVMAVVAQLSSVAYKIAIEKDWIVVIAEGNSSFLTNLNAITRSLDLACKIVSPMTVGYIMTSASTFVSAVVLALWNVGSVFVEYSLLALIYRRVPALGIKGGNKNDDDAGEGRESKTGGEGAEREMMIVSEGKEKVEVNGKERIVNGELGDGEGGVEKGNACSTVVRRSLGVLLSGWRTYARQRVLFAGLALACLYMTVLGFDAITVAYIIANDISAFLVGISMGLAGFTGIIGAYLFSKMAKKFGLEKTGCFSFSAEVLCLTLAVASVWAPGTKFNPAASNTSHPLNHTQLDNLCSTSNHTHHDNLPIQTLLEELLNVDNRQEFRDLETQNHTTNVHILSNHTTDVHILSNHTTPVQHISLFNATSDQPSPTTCMDDQHHLSTNVSMILLLVGIILSRIGLWMSDLVVSQLLQEETREQERGVVNGVQNSLNMLMEMLKFCLVILMPSIHLFGIHIILSFSFVSLAMFCFFYYSFRTHKHKFPEHNIISVSAVPNNSVA